MKRSWIEEEITMKEKTVLRTILSLTLAAFLLCGCGNSKNEAPVEEAPEVASEEEVTEEPEKEEIQEAQQPAEEETPAEEEVTEEPKEEETSIDMPEAQVTTTVADITEFAQYMANLDPKTPHIVIWNEAEGYVIDMGEGEYYQLKIDDRIFLNSSTDMESISYSIPELDKELGALGHESIPDYSQFDKPHECRYKITLKDDPSGERIKLTCYLDAPAE